LQIETQIGIFKRTAQQGLDAIEPVEQRVTMQVHGTSGLTEIAIAAEEAF
jgi:hypothetical protein